MRYRKAMSSQCWEANSQWAGERGHLCPCRSDYRSATRPATQCTKARVISRTDNWTLILVDIVIGMICQADRAYVLASADRLQTKGMFGRLDLGPCCYWARDDTAINHELPSWAAFPKPVGPCFWRWRAWFAKLHWPPYMYAHLCVHKDLCTRIKHIKEEHPWCCIHTSAAIVWSNCFQSTNMRRKGSGMDEKFFRSIEGMIKFDEVFLIIFILESKWHKNGSRLRFFFS